METRIQHLALATATASMLTGFSQAAMPKILQQPARQIVYVGDDATFSVMAEGDPPPAFQWLCNGSNLEGQTDRTLSLPGVALADAGRYSVVVSNEAGSVTSEPAWLSVLPDDIVNLGDREFRFGEPIGPIWTASRQDDAAPGITGDGLTLLYDSTAPGGSGGWDMWQTTRATPESPWGTPVNLGSQLNSAADDDNPIISPDGYTLYFDSNRPAGRGGYDVWIATRPTLGAPFGAPTNLGAAINSSSDDGGALISADNLTLVFSSDRPSGLGLLDIWMSQRPNTNAPWAPAKHLEEPFNSRDYDFPVALSRDGLMMFFKSNHPISQGDRTAAIYVTRRISADQPFGPPVLVRPILGIGSGGVDYSSLSDDGSTLYVNTYATSFPDWPIVYQVSITPLPQLKALGTGPQGEFQFELRGREGAAYEIQASPDLRVWTTLFTTNISGTLNLADPTPAPSRRFYRALSH